jgi:hypothetical protein
MTLTQAAESSAGTISPNHRAEPVECAIQDIAEWKRARSVEQFDGADPPGRLF